MKNNGKIMTVVETTRRGGIFPSGRSVYTRFYHEVPYPDGDYVYALRVVGDCMEARDIYDGDYILVDPQRFPRPMMQDICICKVDYVPTVMCKEYISPAGGGIHNVSTHHMRDKSWYINDKGQLITEQGFFASKIYGAVIACYPPDDLNHARWEIDASELPTELATKPAGKSEVEFVGAVGGEYGR